jgi:putative transposase
MSYSIDMRERAVGYVRSGGKSSEACRIFKIGRTTLYYWLQAEDLRPKGFVPRYRKVNPEKLSAHVRDYPDALLRERAAHFGVTHVAIWRALKRQHITKKNDAVSGE